MIPSSNPSAKFPVTLVFAAGAGGGALGTTVGSGSGTLLNSGEAIMASSSNSTSFSKASRSPSLGSGSGAPASPGGPPRIEVVAALPPDLVDRSPLVCKAAHGHTLTSTHSPGSIPT